MRETIPNHGAQCKQLLTVDMDVVLRQMVDEPTIFTETTLDQQRRVE